MKIALCYESMVPAQGGCETYIADLARRLAEDAHEVHLFAARFDPAYFPVNSMHHPVPEARGPRWQRPWRFARACQRALAHHPHDVSVGFIKTWGQDVLMPQGGLHVASARHNIQKHPQPWKRWIARLLQAFDPKQWSYRLLERKQFFDFPSVLVVPSHMVQRHLHEYYGIHGSRVRVVPNAIDARRFHGHDRLLVRAQTRERWQLAPEDSVGLFIGHNYRLKGLESLLQAVRLIPPEVNFKLLVCGGKRYQPYQRLAERWGIADRIRFLGFVGDVREAFFAADFLIHPSFYDPCALVTMEALACGLPVITTKLNGASELLPPPLAAFTIETPHDHTALAERIVRMSHSSERLGLSRSARDAAQQWTFEHHYQALLQVLQDARRRKEPLAPPVHHPGLVS
jgi:UDP-glucose:(heptosyl)LPS alpha-1,3-glucosyltransferase